MSRTIRRCGLWCVALLMLVACGGATGAPSAAVSASPPSRVASPSAAASADVSQRYAGIAQSVTTEGYYQLGDPAAPVVLMHYSDFL